MFCRQCGQQIPNNARACPNCGAPQGQSKFCPNCGTTVAMNTAVCPNCGTQIGAMNAAPVMQQAAPTPIIINNTNTNSNVNTNNNNNFNGGMYPNYGRRPMRQLKTNRGLLKFILLSLITFGIYGIVVMYSITEDVNLICSPYDGKKTMNYLLLVFVFSWLTLGIAPIVWTHRICNRMGNELRRRGIAYSFGAGTFWGWGVLGSLIVVGPFVFGHKLFRSMNLLAADYNQRG